MLWTRKTNARVDITQEIFKLVPPGRNKRGRSRFILLRAVIRSIWEKGLEEMDW